MTTHNKNITYGVFSALLSSLIMLSIILLMCAWTRKKTTKEKKPSLKLSTSPYTLVEIYAATDGFNENQIMDKCRLGTTYEAVLASGDPVAVKRIHPHLVLRHADAGLRFSWVLKWLAQADHPHVVPILGFSEGPGERMVVMEFMGMKSLEFYLHQTHEDGSVLGWRQRFRVAAGAARGLEYLHETMAPSVVHGYVNPSNILLDWNFNAKICDYGLSFLVPNEKEWFAGYVDGIGGSKESDVYGLGVVLLELLSGRKSDGGVIVQWALPLIKEMKMDELLDSRVGVPCEMKSLVRLAKVAFSCVGNSRKSRPSIDQVVAILNTLEGYPF